MQKATKLHANLDMISENPSIDTCDRWGNMIFFFLYNHIFFSLQSCHLHVKWKCELSINSKFYKQVLGLSFGMLSLRSLDFRMHNFLKLCLMLFYTSMKEKNY